MEKNINKAKAIAMANEIIELINRQDATCAEIYYAIAKVCGSLVESSIQVFPREEAVATIIGAIKIACSTDMEKTSFDAISWHKGMRAEIDIRTLTRGTLRKVVDVVGVDFSSECITLSDGERRYHRMLNEIKLI